jgi:hypothetical protein
MPQYDGLDIRIRPTRFKFPYEHCLSHGFAVYQHTITIENQ